MVVSFRSQDPLPILRRIRIDVLAQPGGVGRPPRSRRPRCRLKEDWPMRVLPFRRAAALVAGVVASIAVIGSTLAVGNVRLSNDVGGGYVSAYTLATGNAYTDNTLDECSVARGRQNEPAVEMNPRDPRVLIGSSNDYCGVYQPPGSATPSPVGPIWLGYYRSEDSGATLQSSLVPGYPDDTSPYAANAHIRTAGAGDPVVAWDGHGRVFMGSESSDDPAGTKKTFGDVWVAVYDNPAGPTGNTLNDGKRFVRSEIVNQGSSAPNLLGVFNDKTSIEADRTGGRCDGNVYFAWSRFTRQRARQQQHLPRPIDRSRCTWSPAQELTLRIAERPVPRHLGDGERQRLRRPSSSRRARTARSTRSISPSRRTAERHSARQGPPELHPVQRQRRRPIPRRRPPVQSRRCAVRRGRRRGAATRVTVATSTPTASPATRSSGATRRPRSTADQADAAHEWVYVVYDPTKPGTEVATGTTYGSIDTGIGSQSGVYFLRYDGASGTATVPALIDNQAVGHQVFPDISAGVAVSCMRSGGTAATIPILPHATDRQ